MNRERGRAGRGGKAKAKNEMRDEDDVEKWKSEKISHLRRRGRKGEIGEWIRD
jgi:hypothetical protein